MITILQKPGPWQAAFSPLLYVASSSNASQANFKFVFDLYVNSVKVSTVKIVPDPASGYGTFDASRILQSYVNSGYFFGDGFPLREVTPLEGKFWATYQLNVGEEYGTPPTTYLNLNVLTGGRVYNCVNQPAPYSSLSIIASKGYDILSAKRFDNAVLTLDDFAYCHYWNTYGQEAITSGAPAQATVTFTAYDKNNSLLGTRSMSSTHCLLEIGYGPRNLNAFFGNFITAATAYYVITIGSTGGGAGLRTIRVTLDDYKKYPIYTLVYLNRMGGFDTLKCNGKSSQSIAVTRALMGNKINQLDRLAASAGYTGPHTTYQQQNIYRGNVRTLQNKFTRKLHVSTPFLSDKDYRDLEEFVTSPLVYLEARDQNDNPQYFPVMLALDSYELKTRRADGLTCLDFDISIPQDLVTQFG